MTFIPRGAVLTSGTIVQPIPLIRGIQSTGGNIGSNNDVYAMSMSETQTNNHRISGLPFPNGYTSGDLIFRIYWTCSFSGNLNEQVQLTYGYMFPKVGTALGDFATTDATVLIDMETYLFDTLMAQDFTIPEVDVDLTANFIASRLSREIGVVGTEFAHSFYVHGMAWVFTGEGI